MRGLDPEAQHEGQAAMPSGRAPTRPAHGRALGAAPGLRTHRGCPRPQLAREADQPAAGSEAGASSGGWRLPVGFPAQAVVRRRVRPGRQ